MTQNMKKYSELVKNDDALRQKTEALKDKPDEQFIEDVTALAKDNGITLTVADFSEEARTGELSDDELEAASGGVNRHLMRLLYKERKKKKKLKSCAYWRQYWALL